MGSAETGTGLDRNDRWQSTIGFALLVVAYWLVNFTAPDASILTDQLDDSWRQGLGIALAQGMRFGHDIVFNQGPLGYFRESPPIPELLHAKLAYWECGYKLAAALVSLLPLLALRGPLWRTLYFLALLVTVPAPDGFAFATIAGGCFFLLMRFDDRSPGAPRGFVVIAELLTLIVIAITMHVKFTYTGLAVAGLGCVFLRRVAERRFLRAAELGVVTVSAYLVTWLACGQQLGDLPEYWRGALAIAKGYNVAMVEFGAKEEVAIATQIFALVTALVIAKLFLARNREGVRTGLACALTIATLLLTFKAGFTRHYGSSVLFFQAAAFAPIFLSHTHPAPIRGLARWLDWLCPWLIAITIACAFRGSAVARAMEPKQLPQLLASPSFHANRALDELDAWQAGRLVRRALHEVEKWRSRDPPGSLDRTIGTNTVDVFGSRQGFVFGTAMRWQPRPVFQSYSAYETHLLEINAAFYRGPRAPQFVLLEGDLLDDRLPTACDTLAIQEVLRRYDYVRTENGFAMLIRSQRPREAAPRPTLLEGAYPISEWIDLPPFDSGCRVLHLDLRPTLAARAQSFLYHVDLPRLDVEMTNGTTGRFRIVPDALRAGVLIDPLCLYADDWSRFFSKREMPHVKRIRVVQPEHVSDAYVDSVAVELVRADDLLPSSDAKIDLATAFPTIFPAPAFAESPQPMSVVEIADDSANLLHPPGILTFQLTPGRYRLRARIGMVETSWTENETDGVTFLIGTDGVRKTTLYERHLDPLRVEAERSPVAVELVFDIAADELLRVATTFGSRGNSDFDWAYVGPLTIEPEKLGK